MSVKAARPIKDQQAAIEGLVDAGYRRGVDILMIRPSSYDDATKVTDIARAKPNTPFLAEVTCRKQRVVGSRHQQILECLVSDGSGRMVIRFMRFNDGMRKATAPGSVFQVYGTASGGGGELFGSMRTMVHPKMRSASLPLPGHLTARYPKVRNIAEATLAGLVRKELKLAANRPDTIPDAARAVSKTIGVWEAMRVLHTPGPDELPHGLSAAIESLKHDEWVAHILVRGQMKVKLKRRKARAIASSPSDIDRFESLMPFRFTGSQRLAMADIAADIARPAAMRRLVHGDVGCGKTLTAAYACWLAGRNGQLAAIMCPTVILAHQHHTRLAPVFEKLGLSCILLTGSMTSKKKKEAQAALNARSGAVVVGTHALIQKQTELPGLSLAVIDEQHRFGVQQRKALESKCPGAHVLMMSATPIPRTLELGLLSHLDITKMTERPQRGDIRTLVFSSNRTDEVLAEIVSSDLQAFWICPLIKRSAKLGLRAAEDEFARIRNLAPQLNAALIHGKLGADAKLSAMRDFEARKTRLLVATTVVEVGVDAPEADVIVIDHAERLGLSQLHQLRGRVGRGAKTGFCALLYEPGLSQKSIERLKVMHETSDGFLVARKDLQQRGPGDIIGKRQSGIPKYRFADLEDSAELMEKAKATAELMLDEHPRMVNDHIGLWKT